MQDAHAVSGQPVETPAEQLLTACAGGPGGRALRFVGDCEEEPADLRVGRSDALLPLSPTTLVLALRGCPSRAGDDPLRVGRFGRNP